MRRYHGVAAALFLTTGTLHFLKPELFLKIVPPRLPWPLGLVYLSGFFELAGGVGLLLPPFRQAAAYGLVALLTPGASMADPSVYSFTLKTIDGKKMIREVLDRYASHYHVA